MSKISTRQKLMDLMLYPQKASKPVLICYDDQIPDSLSKDHTVIVFRDFRKEREVTTTLKNREI